MPTARLVGELREEFYSKSVTLFRADTHFNRQAKQLREWGLTIESTSDRIYTGAEK